MVERALAHTKIKDKTDLYRFVLSKDYILPDLNNRIVTEKWLNEVLQGTCYCPKEGQNLRKNIVRPPTSKLAHQELVAIIKDLQVNWVNKPIRYLLGKMDKPNMVVSLDWVLCCIRHIKPNHKFFDVNYVPP